MNKCPPNTSISELNDLYRFFFETERIKQQFPNLKTEESVRIPQKLAKQILLNNQHIIINGKIKFFTIKNLGLGICQIEINNDCECEETIYVK